jgi:hypothetical protein
VREISLDIGKDFARFGGDFARYVPSSLDLGLVKLVDELVLVVKAHPLSSSSTSSFRLLGAGAVKLRKAGVQFARFGHRFLLDFGLLKWSCTPAFPPVADVNLFE